MTWKISNIIVNSRDGFERHHELDVDLVMHIMAVNRLIDDNTTSVVITLVRRVR